MQTIRIGFIFVKSIATKFFNAKPLTMKIKSIASVALGSSLLFASCQKEKSAENMNQAPNVTYELATGGDARPGVAGEVARTTAGFLSLTGGTASVTQIKFEAKGANKVEYKSNVSQVIDLSSAAATIGGLSVPYGTYEKIEFKIKFEPTTTQPALVLNGSYTPTSGGAAVPVVLQINQPFELKFEKKTPTTIDANTNYGALGTLALNMLTAAVPESLLANATRTNGQIIISSTSNTQLYNPLWGYSKIC